MSTSQNMRGQSSHADSDAASDFSSNSVFTAHSGRHQRQTGTTPRKRMAGSDLSSNSDHGGCCLSDSGGSVSSSGSRSSSRSSSRPPPRRQSRRSSLLLRKEAGAAAAGADIANLYAIQNGADSSSSTSRIHRIFTQSKHILILGRHKLLVGVF